MEGPLVWLVLSRAAGVGRKRLAALMLTCPDPADAWCLTVNDLQQVSSWHRPQALAAIAARTDPKIITEAEREWAAARAAGMRLVAILDPDYPVRLRLIPNPPPYFYQIGPWLPDARPTIAIVGTRKPTAYGRSVAYRIGRELAAAGAVVVSGMARGIDCTAHQGALEAGGTTIAVLAGGADVCYPAEAAPLYRRIMQTGAVISERAPGCEPRGEFFPERNRIISGLAHGTVVVEAGEHSGTLITVDAALDQGRDVFAVPGPITSPMSLGPHRLIQEGAALATTAREILAGLGFPAPAAPSSAEGTLEPSEERVLRGMGLEPQWAGDLVETSGMAPGQVQGILTILEVKGLVRRLPGGQYVRSG